jgi:hypothetical protein
MSLSRVVRAAAHFLLGDVAENEGTMSDERTVQPVSDELRLARADFDEALAEFQEATQTLRRARARLIESGRRLRTVADGQGA